MTAKGPYTGVSLSDLSTLFLRPAGMRPAGQADGAPNHARRTVQLAYELACAAYTMEPESWTQAGWRDFSMLVNRTLMTGEMLNSSATPLNDLTRTTLQTLARLKMSALNPIGQFLGLRQPDEETTTLKAIVMLKPDHGLLTVAVGFMGTGHQLGDWMPNLRMQPEEGFHEGFLQLAQEFDSYLDQIVFPFGAGELGRLSLSLKDIIEDMKRPGSRFRLLLSGHSQGAAVVQVFVDQLLSQGVLRDYICGYGFASPTVAHPGHPLPAGGYPVTHILNSDDLAPRVGAWRHLGECLYFVPEEPDRQRMYGRMAEDPCMRGALKLLLQADNAPEALLNGLSVLAIMRRQSELSLRRFMGDGESRLAAELMDLGEGSLLKWLDQLSNNLAQGYLALSGDPALPEAALTELTGRWEALLTQYGIGAWVRSVRDACLLPHRLYKSAPDYTASYLYIVTEGLPRVRRLSMSAPRLNAVSGGRAVPRPQPRTVYPSWSSGRAFRRGSLRLPTVPELMDTPETEAASGDEDAAPALPAAPVVQRAAATAAAVPKRVAAAFRLLSASRAKKRRK